MQPPNPQKNVIISILLTLGPLVIGLFQGELKTYIIPAMSSLAALLLLEKVWLPILNRNCLRLIEKLAVKNNEIIETLSKGNMEARGYYLALDDPRECEFYNFVLQRRDTQLLFHPEFKVRLQNISKFLIFVTFVLFLILIFTANSLFVWIAYLIWIIPIFMIGSQILRRKKMFRLFIHQLQYARDNKLSKVVHIAKKVGRITKRTFGKGGDYAIFYYNLGGIYEFLNNYREAEHAFEKAYAIWLKINVKTERHYILSLYKLATIYLTNSKFNKAEKHLLELLDIVKEDERFSIEVLKNLTLLKLIQENIQEVKEYNKQIESRIIKYFGKESDEYTYLQYYNYFLEVKKGNLREAQSYYDKDLEKSIRSKLKGEPLAKFLQSQGVYYLSAHNNEKAEEYLNETLDIRLKNWGENHLAVAESKMNIASLNRARGEFDKEEKLIRKSLKIYENCYGELAIKVASGYAELGNCLVAKGNYNEAEICINKALEIYEKLFSKSHPLYLNTRYNLGWLYDEKGDAKKAESIINDVYVKTLKIIGDEHPILRVDRYQIASFKVRNGKYKEALDLYKRTKITDDKLISESFFLGGEQQKLKLMDKVFNDIDKIFSLITKYMSTDSNATSFGMDLILQRKGLVADIITGMNKFYKPDSDTVINNSLKELSDLNREISQLQLEGFENLSVSDYRNTFNKYNNLKAELEETISQNFSTNLYKDIFNKNIREVISTKLKMNDVLIEFIKFRRFNFKKKKYEAEEYLALLQFCNQPNNIKFISLGNGDYIDTLINDVLAVILSNKNLDKSYNKVLMKVLTSLSVILFQPIIDNIDNCNRLYLVPDGELHRIPFEALLTKDVNFTVENYEILYLNSGRDLMSIDDELNETNFTESAIIANPDFNLGEKPDSQFINKKSKRLGLELVDDLPWTEKEAENLSKILMVKPITKQDANKKIVLELSSPEYLHFATHGYFMPKDKGIKKIDVAFIDPENKSNHQLSTIQNPMLRSGLVLAGFNAWFSFKEVPKEMGNGLLTAMDIALMDLSHTRLVVLSACESGLGDIDNGEGVFGLRRAFKIAGSRRLVMTLWTVKDKETQKLMTDFYQYLHEDNIAFYKAFRKTQLKFINETSRNPYFWAAFIFQGIY